MNQNFQRSIAVMSLCVILLFVSLFAKDILPETDYSTLLLPIYALILIIAVWSLFVLSKKKKNKPATEQTPFRWTRRSFWQFTILAVAVTLLLFCGLLVDGMASSPLYIIVLIINIVNALIFIPRYYRQMKKNEQQETD
ncbi:MAG: hypothetical protein IJ710_09870 [Prevotella sp.]|nr:hypothetical protein [Prevotella sp.]